MKSKLFYTILLAIVILLFSVINANAMNTGFSVGELSKEEQDRFVSNIRITLLHKEPAKSTFIVFDVNKDGLIAIGQNTDSRKTISIYSKEGVFQYGYSFNCSGYFGVEWDGDNLNIYFVRSDMIVSVSPSGNVLDVYEVQDTLENNTYVNHYIHATRRTIGDSEYCIGNDLGILNFFASSYSRVVVKDSTGAEAIIYDATSRQHTNAIIATIVVCGGVAIAVVVIAGNIKRGNPNT